MARRIEQIGVFLALSILVLLTLNFTQFAKLVQAFEFRFLFSGAILGLTALFLRFGLTRTLPLHRAAYRIATVMTFWSLGVFLLPYPHTLLYLIVLPALFYLYRIEIRGAQALVEDLVACGILLGLGTLLYLQQQPLQVILFPDLNFQWTDYYFNAPVMIVIGLGFIRLNKHTSWTGFCLLGTVLLLAGLVLTAAFLAGDRLPVLREALFAVAFGHLVLALFFLSNPLADRFFSFSGLTVPQRELFRKQIYLVVNAALQLSILALGWLDAGNSYAIGVILAAIVGQLYAWHRYTVSVAMVQTAILIWPVSGFFFPALPTEILAGAMAALLAMCVWLRRSVRFAEPFLPNAVFAFIGTLNLLLLLLQWGLFTPSGFALLLTAFACWAALPQRPLSVARRNHFWLWPLLSGLFLISMNQGYANFFLPAWALACLWPPLLFLGLLKTPFVGAFADRRGWLIVPDWLSSSSRAVVSLSLFSVAAGTVSFVLEKDWYAQQWAPLLTLEALLLTAVGIFLVRALQKESLKAAGTAQALIWLSLALLRWKAEVLGQMELGSPIDGYALLGLACAAAGFREVLRRKNDAFDGFLARSMQGYALLGWAYMLFLWMTQAESEALHAQLGSVFLSGLYYWLSRTRSKSSLISAFAFGNAAILLFVFDLDLTNPLFYILPTVSSVLVLAHLFKESLGVRHLKAVRLYCSLILLGTSAYYSLIDFETSLWYPLAAALIAVFGVLAGISLRIRIYLFLGTFFFIFNTFAVMVNMVREQPPQYIKLIVGCLFLLTGLFFTGSFLLFQMKRQEVLGRYRELVQELGSWEQ